MARIEVTFLIDANGILHVTARDIRTSEAQSVQVKPSHGLTDDEVEGMIRDSFQFAEEDIKARQVIEARTEANAIIVQTPKNLSSKQEKLFRELAVLEGGGAEKSGEKKKKFTGISKILYGIASLQLQKFVQE